MQILLLYYSQFLYYCNTNGTVSLMKYALCMHWPSIELEKGSMRYIKSIIKITSLLWLAFITYADMTCMALVAGRVSVGSVRYCRQILILAASFRVIHRVQLNEFWSWEINHIFIKRDANTHQCLSSTTCLNYYTAQKKKELFLYSCPNPGTWSWDIRCPLSVAYMPQWIGLA